MAANVKIFNLYDRGSGVFPLPIVNILLYLLCIFAVFAGDRKKNISDNFNLKYCFWIFNALFLLFAVYGLAIGEDVKKIFSARGLINVVNMYLFLVLLLKTFSTREKLQKLADFIIFCAVTRGIWGLARWAFLGGDPANIYANAQKIAVRLTFFDINDSLVATLGIFLAAWQLLYQKTRLSTTRKLFYYLMIGVGLAVVLLSYRRTAWGGLVLAGFWFVWQQPWRRKIQVGFIAGLIGALALPVLISERFSKIQGTSKSGLFYDITTSKGGIATSEGRFSELEFAWKYISDNPLTGIMPWGGIGSGGTHDFVHSGLLHLWLKGGIFALIIFCLILWNYWLFTIKVRREIPAQDRGLSEAAVAGLLFSMPGILFGTPFIETRTSLLLGFIFALPYLVYGLNKPEKAHKPSPYLLKPHFKPVPQAN
ncbi:MAG: O-antigen ligase family protein [Methylomonas sp.]